MLLVWVVNTLFWQQCNEGQFIILRNISTLNRFPVPLAWSSFSGDKISCFYDENHVARHNKNALNVEQSLKHCSSSMSMMTSP